MTLGLLQRIINYLENNAHHNVLFIFPNDAVLPYFMEAVDKAIGAAGISSNPSHMSPSGSHAYTKLDNGSHITAKSLIYINTINLAHNDIIYIDTFCSIDQISKINIKNSIDKQPILLFEFSGTAHNGSYSFSLKGPAECIH